MPYGSGAAPWRSGPARAPDPRLRTGGPRTRKPLGGTNGHRTGLQSPDRQPDLGVADRARRRVPADRQAARWPLGDSRRHPQTKRHRRRQASGHPRPPGGYDDPAHGRGRILQGLGWRSPGPQAQPQLAGCQPALRSTLVHPGDLQATTRLQRHRDRGDHSSLPEPGHRHLHPVGTRQGSHSPELFDPDRADSRCDRCPAVRSRLYLHALVLDATRVQHHRHAPGEKNICPPVVAADPFKASTKLQEQGLKLIAFGLKPGCIGNVPIQTTFPEKTEIDTVTLYVGPERQAALIPEIIALKPRRIIFNPGTENPDFIKLAQDAGIETEIACTLVLLATDSYF